MPAAAHSPRPTRNEILRLMVRILVAAALLLATVVTAPVPAGADTLTTAPSQYEKPPPTPWRACPVNGRDEARDRLVRRFERGPGVSNSGAVMPGGTSDLICGDEKHGYYHIANGHGSEWSQKGMKTSENWRDVADYSIAEALRNPMSVTYRADVDTYCYSREVSLINKVRGIVVEVFHPNVVVRARDGLIITAFPAKKPC
jgi:hypothetical protein